MKKTLFCTVPYKRDPAWFPPLGLMYVEAALHGQGYPTETYDIDALRLSKDTVTRFFDERANEFDLVAISSMATAYNYVAWLAETVKERNHACTVVMGGSLGTSSAPIVLTRTAVDVCVIGEGEHTMLDLVACLSNGGDLSQVAGIAYRNGGHPTYTNLRPNVKKFDLLPVPRLETIPWSKYIYPGAVVTVRGCTEHCTFCVESMEMRAFRQASAERVSVQFRDMRDECGITFFNFLDSHIHYNKPALFRMLEAIEPLGVEWDCNGRLDRVNPEVLQRMKDAGCRRIFYGIESWDQGILDEMRKGITIDQMNRGLEYSFESGIPDICASYIVGSFGDTPETIERTVREASRWPIPSPGVFLMTPFPGTPDYQRAYEMGLIPDEEAYLRERIGLGDEYASITNKFNINLTRMSDEELLDCYHYMRKALGAELTPFQKLKDYTKSKLFKYNLLKAR